MEFKFNNETTEGETPVQPQEKGRQTGLLVLLVLLLGGFGYLYFFTGLIRPQEQPPAPQPPQVVKQPLPARDAAPAEPPKSAEQKAQATSPPAASPVPAAPAAKAVTKSADSKVAAAPVAKPEEKKPASVKPEPAKSASTPAAKKPEPVKPALPAKQTEKAAVTPKAVPQKTAAPVRKAVAAPKKNGPWTVVAGLYVVEETLAADLPKVKKAGLTPLMTSGPKRPVSMHRLFYNEYADKDKARQAVEMLRSKAGDGFSVQRGDKHEVYAGSYAVQSGARSEQQRLAAAGINVTIRKSQVPLASRKLTAGTFTDRKAAEEALKKLKGAGIAAPMLE